MELFLQKSGCRNDGGSVHPSRQLGAKEMPDAAALGASLALSSSQQPE